MRGHYAQISGEPRPTAHVPAPRPAQHPSHQPRPAAAPPHPRAVHPRVTAPRHRRDPFAGGLREHLLVEAPRPDYDDGWDDDYAAAPPYGPPLVPFDPAIDLPIDIPMSSAQVALPPPPLADDGGGSGGDGSTATASGWAELRVGPLANQRGGAGQRGLSRNGGYSR